MQFRLFHQIPELLSIFINESLDRKKLMSNSEYEFNKSVKLSNMAMNHIIECVHPLATLMYPSEYYSIRRNLGETSGSMSKSLNVTMSKNALFLKDLISNNSVSIAHQIKFEANIYLMLARKWRDIHIMLPKHILGSGAASLMGNENAILEASNLNDRFINKITENSKYKMLEYMGKNDGHSGVEHLISLTGNLTRHEFSNVEQRAKLGRKHGRKKN